MLQGRRPFACALLLALVPYSLTYCSHDDPNGVLPAFGQTCATVVGAFGCAAVFGGTPIGQLCPVTCNNCTCVDDQSGILAGAGQTCAAVVAGLTCQGTVPVLNLPVNTTCGQTCICGGAGGSPANTTSGNCTSNPDSTALSSLYSATNGSGWLNNTGWLQGFACPSNATTESTGAWYGVRCTSCRVSGLFLGQNNLVGTVSAADICSLSAITSLQINTNAISGTIPACVASLIALKSLRLFKNDFSGIAPSTYPPALSELLLHANRLSGFVPDNTSLPLSLQSLLVGDNAMSGVFPAGIERLPALFALDLRNNRLSGTVPTSIGESRSLIMITASGNLFSGHIPAEISKMSILYILLLASNRLSGTLPRELENNQLLSYIDFSDNKISGTIPKEYGNMTQKSLIETVGAALFAECADFLSNFPYSGQLVLHKNSISGTIPPELGNLDNMTLLTLHKNRVSGTIPASLSRVSGMQVLMAHDNNLDGSIPDAFEGLRNLRYVMLHNNRLSCDLPNMDLPNLELSTVLLGNSMSAIDRPIPGWVNPDTKGNELLYTTRDQTTESGVWWAPLVVTLALFAVFMPLSMSLFQISIREIVADAWAPSLDESPNDTENRTTNKLAKDVVAVTAARPSAPPESNATESTDLPRFHPLTGAPLTKEQRRKVMAGETVKIQPIISSNPLAGGTGVSSMGSPVQTHENASAVGQSALISSGGPGTTDAIHDDSKFTIGRGVLRMRGRGGDGGEGGGGSALMQSSTVEGRNFLLLSRLVMIATVCIGGTVFIALLPIYLSKASFYSCVPSWIPKLTVAYFYDGGPLEAYYASALILYILGVLAALSLLYRQYRILHTVHPHKDLTKSTARVGETVADAKRSNNGLSNEDRKSLTRIRQMRSLRAVVGGSGRGQVAAAARASRARTIALAKSLKSMRSARKPNAAGNVDLTCCEERCLATACCQHWLTQLLLETAVYLLWLVFIVLLSFPVCVFVFYQTLPTNNTLGVDTNLTMSTFAIALVVVFTQQIVIPLAAHQFARHIQLGKSKAAKLIMISRLLFLMVPIAVLAVFDQGCYQYYLELWRPCADSTDKFDVDFQFSVTCNGLEFMSWEVALLETADVCSPGLRRGYCARRTVVVLATLYFYQVAIQAFLVPPLVLLAYSPWAVAKRIQITGSKPLFDYDYDYAQLFSNLGFLLWFGPFSPIMWIVGMCDQATTYLVNATLLKRCRFYNPPEALEVEKPFVLLLHPCILFCLMAAYLFWDSEFSGYLAVVVIMMVLAASMFVLSLRITIARHIKVMARYANVLLALIAAEDAMSNEVLDFDDDDDGAAAEPDAGTNMQTDKVEGPTEAVSPVSLPEDGSVGVDGDVREPDNRRDDVHHPPPGARPRLDSIFADEATAGTIKQMQDVA